jgi:hypothetical protein
MNRLAARLPVPLVVLSALAMLIHGPIRQFALYHEFADQRALFGISHAADVLSNVGFALVGVWALARLWPARRDASIAAGWAGYQIFFVALVLAAAGSAFYHLNPDNTRLVWDRLPIALACAGFLAAVRAETHPGTDAAVWTLFLSAAAVASVVWWYVTDRQGVGDLRPYLLLQGVPVFLIPLWQTSARSLLSDRIAFGSALSLYMLAKWAELNDHEIFAATHWISGHTLKHLLAIAASAVIAARLVSRATGNNLTSGGGRHATEARQDGQTMCSSVPSVRVPNNRH